MSSWFTALCKGLQARLANGRGRQCSRCPCGVGAYTAIVVIVVLYPRFVTVLFTCTLFRVRWVRRTLSLHTVTYLSSLRACPYNLIIPQKSSSALGLPAGRISVLRSALHFRHSKHCNALLRRLRTKLRTGPALRPFDQNRRAEQHEVYSLNHT